MPDTATAISPLPCHNFKATTIAIIGAGFSGTMLALHLMRRCPADTQIILIERNEHHGPGLAYATPHPCHLLNVPAGKMSAFPERPLDFLHWLQRTRPDELGTAQPAPTMFVPRAVYGMYLRSVLRDAMRAQGPHERLVLLQGNVIGLDHRSHPQRLRLEHGQPVAADIVVLAHGNLPPRPIPLGDGSFYQTPFYCHDPRAPDALIDLHPDQPVLLIGTGLTMVDTVVALLDQHHRGPIHALSRRGKLPHKHTSVPPAPEMTAPYPARLTALLRLLRAQASTTADRATDWRGVIDALRPFTNDLWQAFSLEDQRRFLRHLQPWWDIHRHRMADTMADRVEAARALRQLQVHAGRLQACAVEAGMATASFRPRGNAETVTLSIARVINCSGPGIDCARLADPLLQALLRDGAARPDRLGLGLDVSLGGAIRTPDGSISRRIFAVGPVTRAAFWEMTAVPDIRHQCETLARHLSAVVNHSPRQPLNHDNASPESYRQAWEYPPASP